MNSQTRVHPLRHRLKLLPCTVCQWCLKRVFRLLLKEVVSNCDQWRRRGSLFQILYSECASSIFFCLFCRLLEGSLILNRILWTVTTKQSCFISLANDLAQTNVIYLAKLKDNLQYTCTNSTNRCAWTHSHRDTCNCQCKSSGPLPKGSEELMHGSKQNVDFSLFYHILEGHVT